MNLHTASMIARIFAFAGAYIALKKRSHKELDPLANREQDEYLSDAVMAGAKVILFLVAIWIVADLFHLANTNK